MPVSYSVIGGIAMAFHDEPRFTRDIDFLVAPDQTEKVKRALEGIGYSESSEPWTFKNTHLTLHRSMKTEGEDYLMVDVLSGAEHRHKEIIENSSEEQWAQGSIRIAKKEDIIWMKQQRGSDQDRIEIRKLKDDKNRKDG